MKERYVQAHMRAAYEYAKLSFARRKKVGCIIVADDQMFMGFNGTPPGWDNNCEEEITVKIKHRFDQPDALRDEIEHLKSQWFTSFSYEPDWTASKLVTKDEVYHAETNALAKLAKSTCSGRGASVFITLAPCLPCAKPLAQLEISELFYGEVYRGTEGIEHLIKNNIPVTLLQPDPYCTS